MKFGDYIRQCREQNKWTQPKAATKIEIEQSYLSKLETGKSYPSEEIFNKLVDIYQLDVDELYDKISSDELNILKDIKLVREAILKRNNSKIKTTRSWLIAGLIMLSFGGVFLAASILPIHTEEQYTYRSDGNLHLDEELNTFELVKKEKSLLNNNVYLIEKREILLTRLAYMDEVSSSYKGEAYVKKTFNGRRYFQLIDCREVTRNYANRWFLLPSLLLLIGGLSSFYISRRWD